MAYISIPNVKIVGLSAAVPKEIEDNRNIKGLSTGEIENIINLTGIKERRVSPAGRVCSDYCTVAAERLISELGWEKETIDALIYISVSRDYIEPNTSTIIQGRLGLSEDCYTIDVPMACSGYCYGLSVVGSLLTNGCIKRALMLVGDTPTKIMSHLDKTLWPLHGDAGTATALEYAPGTKPMLFNLKSDGTRKDAIIAPATGVREPVNAQSLEMVEIEPGIIRNRTHVAMDGMGVFSFTISSVPKCIKELCEHYEIAVDNVNYLLLHQANEYIDEKIRKKLKFPQEKTPYSLYTYGNTSSGTIPITMVTKLSGELQSQNNKIIMCGFGAGLSWASVYIETEPFKVLPLIEY